MTHLDHLIFENVLIIKPLKSLAVALLGMFLLVMRYYSHIPFFDNRDLALIGASLLQRPNSV